MTTTQPLFTVQEWLTSTADELRSQLAQIRIEERYELESWLATHPDPNEPQHCSVVTELAELEEKIGR